MCVSSFVSENYIKNEQTIMLWNQQKLLRKELVKQKRKEETKSKIEKQNFLLYMLLLTDIQTSSLREKFD